jgi:hypothetical protein
MVWGGIATSKLVDRTRRMEEAIRHAEAVESSAKALKDQADEIKRGAIPQSEQIKADAYAIVREAQRQANVARLRQEGNLQELYPGLQRT